MSHDLFAYEGAHLPPMAHGLLFEDSVWSWTQKFFKIEIRAKNLPSKHLLFSKTSWRRLQRNNLWSIKTSWRRVCNTSSKNVFKTSSVRLHQDEFLLGYYCYYFCGYIFLVENISTAAFINPSSIHHEHIHIHSIGTRLLMGQITWPFLQAQCEFTL